MTPPNLLGIDRRIAYSHKKYHSGLICKGVVIGLAGKKFSGSVRSVGVRRVMKVRIRRSTINPIISFTV